MNTGNGVQAVKEIARCLTSNIVSFHSWGPTFGETDSVICDVLRAYLDVTSNPYQGPTSTRAIFEACTEHDLKPGWDALSILLWALRPQDYFPIKISYYRKLRSELGHELPPGRPNPDSLHQLIQFGHAFQSALAPEKPADWVDVQSFIWCVRPEESLGHPFDEIFISFEEAQWAFDVLQRALIKLGVVPTELDRDLRMSLTLTKRSREGVRLRLNFGNWAILTFLNLSVGSNRAQYVCREDLLSSSPPTIVDEHRFAEKIDGQTFGLASCPIRSLHDAESIDRKAFEASLLLVAQRFADWKSGPYQAAHQPKVLEMVFDPEVRDELLRTGLEVLPEPSSPLRPEPPTMDEIIPAAEMAVAATGFVQSSSLLRRFVVSLATKPFVILTGNSGTGKTKLAELFAEWLCGKGTHGCALVPVGADWTDSRNVLGFVNHLRMSRVPEGSNQIEVPLYQSTKILDLLLTARNEPDRPFFLILDEMNLSHVERYFADFLSTLESRDGTLFLHQEGRSLPRKMNGPTDVPETLALPRNVFFIGTVNVDETTYMFSPKVLDRANVLEFRVEEAAPKAFLATCGKNLTAIAPAPESYATAFLKLSYRARAVNASAPLTLVAAPGNLPSEAAARLQSCRNAIEDLFFLMQLRHQEFAFRSMAEILRYLAVDYELGPTEEKWDWKAALDAQVLQKIFPKLHGSKRKIGSLLIALATYCERAENLAAAEEVLKNESKAESYSAVAGKRATSPYLGASYCKLCDMIEAVRRDQFVSYIQ